MSTFRKSIAVAVVGVLTVTLAACGGGTSDADGTTTPTTSVTPEEGRTTVDVTVSRDLLDPDGSWTDEDVVAEAMSQGIAARVTADGDVVYTMTPARHQEMLDGFSGAIDQAITELTSGDNSFTAIEASDRFDRFTVRVDGARFTDFEPFYAVSLFLVGGLHQQFDGVAADDVDVTVSFVDDATGETLTSTTLQEFLAGDDA
ncbi:hypothetical protein [Xylanimonas protaetiae]|uniref:Uncharacterized protein n=1 Tax=Xylanimonas protaetiae TaxID=2509457 RepID=A0A4P6F730_9MICO|nr:hypothetical protein [Xylanimonas protaetiae]QAY71285.1 hypothetical protein ET471_15655 [Xylanimonas protaetiae]